MNQWTNHSQTGRHMEGKGLFTSSHAKRTNPKEMVLVPQRIHGRYKYIYYAYKYYLSIINLPTSTHRIHWISLGWYMYIYIYKPTSTNKDQPIHGSINIPYILADRILQSKDVQNQRHGTFSPWPYASKKYLRIGSMPRILKKGKGIGTLNPILGSGLDSDRMI